METVRLLHGFTFFRSLGGVESILRLHHEADATHGVDSLFCAYFEPASIGIPRVHGLGLTGLSSMATARKRFRSLPALPRETIVYHNFWGLAFFGDLDRASRRIGILHTDTPGLPSWLRNLRGLTDGALCVSEPLLELVKRELPELASERVAWLPYPVSYEKTEADQAPLGARPVVLGFSGRLSFEQKRVDRFPEFVCALDKRRVDFRLEFLGDGPQSSWLQKQFANDPRIRFHGRLSGASYWRVLKTLDAIVFVSDYEGLPIALLEAMTVGVLPIVPRVGSGADSYAMHVRADLLYPAGDMDAAAAIVQTLANSTHDEIATLRQRANKVVEPHLGDRYLRTFAEHVSRIAALPRISQASFVSAPLCPRLFIPFGVLRRFWLRALWKPVFSAPIRC